MIIHFFFQYNLKVTKFESNKFDQRRAIFVYIYQKTDPLPENSYLKSWKPLRIKINTLHHDLQVTIPNSEHYLINGETEAKLNVKEFIKH